MTYSSNDAEMLVPANYSNYFMESKHMKCRSDFESLFSESEALYALLHITGSPCTSAVVCGLFLLVMNTCRDHNVLLFKGLWEFLKLFQHIKSFCIGFRDD